jgi:hypothetical protein
VRGWSGRFRSASRGQAVLASLALAACTSGPTEIIEQPLEVLIAGGDSQFGTSGQTLLAPLHVVVQNAITGLPAKERDVRWTVEAGSASIVSALATLTDSTGSARATVRLGSTTGEVTVRASVPGQNNATAVFRLYLVDRPELDALEISSAVPGASLNLSGRNFSPNAEQNVVLFSGMRARVTSATATALSVTVPECLPERSVSVTVQLGVVASTSRPLDILPGGSVQALPVGGVFDADDADGYPCVTLPGDGTAEYLVIAQAASTVGSATHPVTLFGLSRGMGAPTRVAHRMPSFGGDTHRGPTLAMDTTSWRQLPFNQAAHGTEDVQFLWDARLRWTERMLTLEPPNPTSRTTSRTGPRPAAAAPAAVPAVGERRSFSVYRGPGDFARVTAEALHVGAHAALFVDVDAPAGGFTPGDLQLFSQRFDDVMHPVVTQAFGSESDLDRNERVIILFTPVVNALTPRGSAGFVGGFFFGVDLLADQPGSNAGEIFYSLVPDPAGAFGDPRTTDRLLAVVPAVLAHEFQHMVNFNERVLRLDAASNETVWLSEALAQYAEELVARRYEAEGDGDGVALFRGGVRTRARRYLARPDTVSLIVSAGQGTLAERGGGFLFLTYLAGRYGPTLASRLTRTTLTGIENVETQTGASWPGLLRDWWAASWLDGMGVADGPLDYPDTELRPLLGTPFPLVPEALGQADFIRSLALRSSAAAYYIVKPSTGGSSTLRIGGEEGGASAAHSLVQLRVVRLR